jgi:hypothetical protein
MQLDGGREGQWRTGEATQGDRAVSELERPLEPAHVTAVASVTSRGKWEVVRSDGCRRARTATHQTNVVSV